MFDQHGSFFQERMDPDSGLLDKLLGNKTLSRIECDDIKDHHPFYRRNARLLHYINGNNKYDSLIEALRDNRQTHLVNYLKGNGEYKSEYGGDWPLTENEISILDTNQESLVDLVDCSELLPRLYSAQVINRRQRVTISSEPNDLKRNEVLLDILRRRSVDDYRQVVQCLHESNQSHVAEILDKGGVVVRVHGDLGNDKDADHTEDNIISIIADILSGKSLEETSRILKKTELKVIAAKKGHSVVLYVYCRTDKELMDLYEMNLSGTLRSTIERLFSQLLLCSTTTEHAEVTVDNLKDVVECAFTQLFYRSQMKRLTVTLPTEEYKKCRSYFSDECSIIRAVCDIGHRKITRIEYNDLMNTAVWVTVTAKNDPYSKMLTFRKGDYMMTTAPVNIGDESVWWKVEHLGDGRIGYIPRNHVVMDYNQELRATNTRLGQLKRPIRSRTTTVSSSTKMNFLPLELLDIILQKSYLHYAFNRGRFKDEIDRFLVTRLATVERCWSERLRRRKFKRIICRRLSDAFNKIHRVSFVLRSNKSFLMETLRLREGLIDQLRLCDCLTDVQSRLINRQTVTSGKGKVTNRNNSSDLLHFISSCDDIRRSDCFRSLRQSSQKLVMKVIDNGGVAIKVNLSSREAGNLQRLSERLNDLHGKAKPRSARVERAINQLIDRDIEILHSHMDRQAVLYFWCKSEKGHENLRTLCESKSIVDVIGDLTKNTSSAPEPVESRMIDTDIYQFKKIFVVCPIVERFTARLDVNEDEQVMGVTMLRQEICILCRGDYSSAHVIRVLQNRNPFPLSEKINIGEFCKNPEDIGSSDDENCFFVVDSKERCLWKIARKTGNYHKFLHLQFTYFPRLVMLPVSCDGQELLILTPRSLDIYRAYRPRGAVQKPLLTVHLPSDIDDPLHAVETSSGDFVVLHSVEKDVNETVKLKVREKQLLFAVSKVTRDGRLVRRRFVPQNEAQELKAPCYLALDSDDRVFVADEGSGRVILLDSDLSWIRIFCQSDFEDQGKILPHRLCCDKVDRQLIVSGLYRREVVNVYSIDRK